MSRLSHCLLLSFIAIALVQASASSLRGRSAATQVTLTKSYLATALQDIQQAQAALELESVAPQTICITGDDNNAISYGKQAGKFGTSDFSVAFWVKTSETLRYFDLFGNRNSGSHGNFFQIRMTGNHESIAKGTVIAEIDQDAGGTNFAYVYSSKTGLNDGQWHHVAAVRQGTTFSLYIDGASNGSYRSSGVTNIDGAYPLQFGRSLDRSFTYRFSAAACYSGPRTALRAWSAQEVSSHYTSTRPQ